MAGRKAKRVQAVQSIPVGILGGDTYFTAQLVDISRTGMLVRCAEDLPVGTVGRIGIPMAAETLRIVAVVRRRIDGIGLAFEFVQMTHRDRAHLHRLILRLEQMLTAEFAT
ncbi:MAG: PilZ domain-containing protein [Acidobacteriia bacterium]|nr:PilZ domain-containing protein [Terriglobia bacterium]